MKHFNYKPEYVEQLKNIKVDDKELIDKKFTIQSSKKSKKHTILAVSPKTFADYKQYAKRGNNSPTLVGETKFNLLPESKDTGKVKVPSECDAILRINNADGSIDGYEVRDKYKWSRIVGYVPVGNNQFVAVARLNPIIWIIAAAFLLLCMAGVVFTILSRIDNPTINPYIEYIEVPEANTDDSATRYRLNTTLTIVQDTIQNLNFENFNEGKYIRVKFKLEENKGGYIYDSELVPFGSKVTTDVLKKHVEPGTYRTIAECYVYSEDKQQIAQTNFKITLNVK